MLVCAPTGAGKTNIALLTIARELLLHMREGVLHVADFKIVYAERTVSMYLFVSCVSGTLLR
jgi:replicative superfamily II helicase